MGDKFVKGKAMLKLWAAPRLAPDGREVEGRRLVDVEIDGWLLGPLHVADYDVMETLHRLRPLDVSPPGWGSVSLYGLGLDIRHRAGGTREGVVEAGRRAAMVMWEHVLQHVVARVGDDEAAVVEALRAQAEGLPQGQDRTLGELMVELAQAIAGELAAAEALAAARVAVREAEAAAEESVRLVNRLTGAVVGALADAGVPDVG